jgi:DpnII restriction endonuclease
MARAKTSEQSRVRSKAATIEELTRGIGNLQEFLAKVEDLGREGFPYLDAARARTELQFRECIRRTFGEKSSEFQEHRHQKLLMGSPEETQQSLALIKTLIATLEQKKQELQGGPPPAQVPPTVPASPAPVRPQLTVVPPSIPTVQMTMMRTAPVSPPPVIMSVAMTTNLDLSSATVTAPPPPLAPVPPVPPVKPEPLSPSTSQHEPSAIVSAPPAQVMPDPPTQPVARPAPAASAHTMRPPQPPRHEPEPIMQAIPSAKPAPQMQESLPMPPQLQPSPSMLVGASLHQEPAPPPLQNGSSPVDLVKTLCGRFHAVARQLRLRGEYRATLSVEDEFDAQDLLHALLRIQFDDIGTDEWMPSYADGSPRTTLLLNDGRLAVIVKKTRPGLNAKDLGDQLRVDAERYRSRDRCTTLFCFMYDPEGRIGNPRGLEASLTSVNESFMIEVLVAPK